MSGIIYFFEKKSWVSNSIGFVDMMERMMSECASDESDLKKIINDAIEMGSLGFDNFINNEEKRRVGTCLYKATVTNLARLHADPSAHSGEVKSVEALSVLAKEYLEGLPP